MGNTYKKCACGALMRRVSKKCRSCWKKEDASKIGKAHGFKEGYTPWNKNTKGLTKWKPQRREKIMAHFKKHGSAMKGKKHTIESRMKTSEAMRGDKAPNWKGGRTPLNTMRRHTIGHRIWRESVFKRDDWTCQVCLKRGGKLEPNHIRPWRSHPALQFDVENGITLCKVPCHRLTINREEILIDFFDKLLVMGTTQNRVNSGNLLEKMKKILRQS